MVIATALTELKQGKIILIYHSSERETAMVVAAEKINLKMIRTMKRYASGDISCVISLESAEKLGLPFMIDILKAAEKRFPVLKKFKKRISSCSVPLDHIECRTGSSDKDKLLLINELVKIVKSKQYEKFCSVTCMPGHLKFFIAKDLATRQGHTELSIALMELAGMLPVAVICSMRDPATGSMLSKTKARQYAIEHDLVFIDDQEIINCRRCRNLK